MNDYSYDEAELSDNTFLINVPLKDNGTCWSVVITTNSSKPISNTFEYFLPLIVPTLQLLNVNVLSMVDNNHTDKATFITEANTLLLFKSCVVSFDPGYDRELLSINNIYSVIDAIQSVFLTRVASLLLIKHTEANPNKET